MDGGFTTTCNPSKIVDGLYYITSTITFLPMVSVFGKINFTCLVENSLPPVATGTTTVTINGELFSIQLICFFTLYCSIPNS